MTELREENQTGYRVLRFGAEQHPVVVMDGFAGNPDALVEAADKQSYAPGGAYYPGVRAAADPAYLAERVAVLQAIITDVFEMPAGVQLTECNFSIVTTAPAALTPIQRLPHFDGTDPGRLALLHYLSGPSHGGTSFYRHRATGFETVTDARLNTYKSALADTAATSGLPPARYFQGDTDQFERIGQIEARYNRAILYRGITLHSGDILKPDDLDTRPREGRLSVNAFMTRKVRSGSGCPHKRD